MKTNWLDLCVTMMLDYIPTELDTWENHDKHLEICEHFSCVSMALSARIKAERCVDRLMIDDNEIVARISRIMKTSARQSFEFTKKVLLED